MATKKFIKSVKSFLELKDFKKEGKKKSLEKLLKKLNTRKISVTNLLETSLGKKEKKELKENIKIISFHIRKGKKLLNDLSSKK